MALVEVGVDMLQKEAFKAFVAAGMYSGLPVAPPYSEGPDFDFLQWQPCRTFRGPLQCGVEWDEWVLVRGLVPRNATVLELGARY